MACSAATPVATAAWVPISRGAMPCASMPRAARQTRRTERQAAAQAMNVMICQMVVSHQANGWPRATEVA